MKINVSLQGLCAVLSVEDEAGRNHIIAYASKTPKVN